MKKKSTMLSIILLLSFIFVACSPTVESPSFTIMLSDGVGYNVNSEQIVSAKRGDDVEFDIEILTGYIFDSTSIGTFDGEKLKIENVRAGTTVRFVCVQIANVSKSVRNGNITVTPSERDFIIGTKATVEVAPFNNYYIDEVTVNDMLVEADLSPDGSLTFEIDITETMINIDAVCLGQQYNLYVRVSGDGNITTNVDGDIVHYGDTVKFEFEPTGGGGGKLLLAKLNGAKINVVNNVFETVVDGSIMLDAMFAGEFTGAINYMKNIPNQPQEFYETQLFTYGYINLDNIYSEVNIIENYICVGLNTKADGSGKDYNFGAMLYLEEDIDLYFQWAKETDKEYLEYEQVENGISILGLSEEGKQAKLETLVIPKVIEDEPVINIANESFSENEDLRLVILGNNILSIDDKAFYGTNIERVILTDSIESFSLTTFDNCDELETIELNSIFSAVESGQQATLAYRYAKLNVPNRVPRYMIIGGSSVKHGICPATFNNEMDYEVMIAGVHEPQKIYCVLSIAASLAISGDVIIVAPEYFFGSYADGSISGTTVDTNYRYIAKSSDIFKWINFQKARSTANGMLSILQRKTIYNHSPDVIIDDYGAYAAFKPNNIATYGNPNTLSLSKSIITENGIMFFSFFSDLLEKKGAKLYFSFAPYNFNGLTATAKNKSHRDEFQDLLRSELNKVGIPLISDINDYIFEGQYFFDSSYHLSTEGAIMRTQQLIADIKAQQAKEAAESGN